MSSDFATSIRKIEDLPTDNGRTVDTIAGALLRIFVRLEENDAAMARLRRRLAALEGPQPQRPATSSANPATETASPTPANIPAALVKRGRGRPPGSPNKRPGNGHDDGADEGGLDPERDLAY